MYKKKTPHDEHGRTNEPDIGRNHKRPIGEIDRSVFISKIDLDFAYGQMELFEERSRQCVFALPEQNLADITGINKLPVYGLAMILTKFQEKTDRTLEYSTPSLV